MLATVRSRSARLCRNPTLAAISAQASERRRTRANAECSHCSHRDRRHDAGERPLLRLLRTAPGESPRTASSRLAPPEDAELPPDPLGRAKTESHDAEDAGFGGRARLLG